jgi:hypothetical protein
MSTPVQPGRQAGSRADQTSRAAWPSASMVMSTSLPAASSASEPATGTPRSASGAARPAVRFQTVSVSP